MTSSSGEMATPSKKQHVEVDGKFLRRNCVHLKPAGQLPNLEKTQSAQKPNANVKDRASETKHSSFNPVPSSKQLKSEPAKPVKSAKKMELVVAKRTRSGRLVKTPARYSS